MTKARTNADNASADIQGVTAGTGLSGGGTSGTVTLTNDMATTIDAKGDLVVGTGADTYSRLATGNAGETLVADSSASTGLRWQGNFAAGKNKIINGDFNIWQRGTSFTLSSGVDTYCADRFLFAAYGSGTAGTGSRQTFTAGTAPVAGYEGQYFGRITNFSTASAWQFRQRMENVQTFAGQTITFSFWAKASASMSNITVAATQNFGSGGSTAVSFDFANGVTLTTSWTRYSYTYTVPSISGKTIGTGSYFEVTFYQGSGATNSSTIDTWGWQVENGNTVTAFQTATGTLAGEYLACARYYQKSYNLATAPGTDTNDGLNYSAWSQAATTTGYLSYEIVYPVRMRTAATVVTYDVADASGKVSRVTPAGTDQNGLTPNTAFGNEARILIQSSSGNSHSGLALHWTASAEL